VSQFEAIVNRYGGKHDAATRSSALSAIGAAINDESPRVRRRAFEVLYMLGSKARPILKELDRALDGPDKSMRVMVGDVLLRVAPEETRDRVIAMMSGLLLDKSLRLEHYRLVHVLKNAKGEEATAEMLVPLLKHPDLEIRLAAVFDLTVHCPGAKALRPAMLDALAGTDVTVREEAAFYFLQREPEMVDQALELLADQTANPGEGSYLAWDLVKRAREASPGSIKRLAARLIERLGKSTKPESLQFLIAALGEIGSEAVSGLPALLKLADANDTDIATRAVAAMVKIDPRVAATKIESLLEWMSPGHDSTIRMSAIASLRDLGQAAATAVPLLLKVADEKDLTISAGAIEAISKIDPVTAQALKQAIARGEAGADDN
jgi:hypothetical protein